MISVFLVTNGGSGEDGDEWILDSIHATRESAEAVVTIKNHNFKEWEVEEWDLEGSILTDKERAAIGWAIMECDSMPTQRSREAADTLRSLLERTK